MKKCLILKIVHTVNNNIYVYKCCSMYPMNMICTKLQFT